jgi:hypothetical protein
MKRLAVKQGEVLEADRAMIRDSFAKVMDSLRAKSDQTVVESLFRTTQ